LAPGSGKKPTATETGVTENRRVLSVLVHSATLHCASIEIFLVLKFPRRSKLMPEKILPGSDHGSSEEKQKRGTTRRTFLKSAGLVSASVAGAEMLGNVAHAESQQEAGPVGPGKIALKLQINGEARTVNVEPRTTLAEALRDELHLTGTKVVCDRGSCSACTVMLDKTPVCSCMTLAVDVGDRNVTTIEGLARGEDLHPIQAAFIEHDALQCGFCTSGMLMSCAALLERNPKPSSDDVKTAISGNICRCATYPKVLDAVLAASQSRGA
jgi:xanthine dehydrogenase YagT iron-sulfur-binding subunit